MMRNLNFTRRATAKTLGVYRLALVFLLVQMAGCGVLRPDPIVRHRNNLPSDLIADDEPIIERGQKRPIIDAFGWVWGIPSKILLWNRRIESHSISQETELLLQDYLIENDLVDVKVRINQYRPLEDWRRLTKNKSVAWPWRYTFGAVATLGETVIPGRLFGGDHYNPYTATIHLYSDVPAIAYHEGAHAKDFSNREYPGTYAALYVLPIVPLWHERTATNDVLAYVRDRGDAELQSEAMHVLYPAYGTYVGNAAGTLLPTASTPLYLASVIAGHVVARRETP